MKKLLSIMVLVITSVMLATPGANAKLRGVALCLKAAQHFPVKVTPVSVTPFKNVNPNLYVKPIGPIKPTEIHQIKPIDFNALRVTSQLPDSLRIPNLENAVK